MLKILIVDDSVFSQKTTANFIQSILGDVTLFTANDGQEGLTKYKEVKPDFIFVDLLMPKMDGKELIRCIKEYDNNANIIVLSADVQKNVREELEKSNILAFINKPLNDEKKDFISNLIRNANNG